MVSARTNSANHLVRFGCRKNELHVSRWFFDNLEQRIEALRRDHVSLIQDKNLVAITGWCKNRSLAQFTSIIDTVVARGIDLDHVERTAAIA